MRTEEFQRFRDALAQSVGLLPEPDPRWPESLQEEYYTFSTCLQGIEGRALTLQETITANIGTCDDLVASHDEQADVDPTC